MKNSLNRLNRLNILNIFFTLDLESLNFEKKKSFKINSSRYLKIKILK